MSYRLADFIYKLECYGLGEIDMQSDEALNILNECLPRNMLVAVIPTRESYDSQADVSQDGD